MLSAGARGLLKIPDEVVLPSSLGELYDRWFYGNDYETRFGEGWIFDKRGRRFQDGYDVCISHRTAQFAFGLDREFRLHVLCDGWVQIASSFLSIVENDAVMVASKARGGKRRGFGTFPGFEEFVSRQRDYLSEFQEIASPDPEFKRIFIGPKTVVTAERFYTDQYLIGAIEYF